MSQVEDKVKDIIVQQLGVNAEEVTTEASFINDLSADSLDIVELVMAFEEEFGIEIPDEGHQVHRREACRPAGIVTHLSAGPRRTSGGAGFASRSRTLPLETDTVDSPTHPQADSFRGGTATPCRSLPGPGLSIPSAPSAPGIPDPHLIHAKR